MSLIEVCLLIITVASVLTCLFTFHVRVSALRLECRVDAIEEIYWRRLSEKLELEAIERERNK